MNNNIMGMSNIAARHGEHTSMFSGNVMPANKQASYIENKTFEAYQDIKDAAINNDTTPEDISLNYLLNNLDALQAYIRLKGETPSSGNNGVVVQAMLLRMNDIDTIAKAGKISEDEAYKEIQEAESEAFLLNTADKDTVLSPSIQAALNCLIVVLLNKMTVAVNADDISSALVLIEQSMATPLNNFDPYGKNNRADGEDDPDLSDIGEEIDPSLSDVGDTTIADTSPSLSPISISAPTTISTVAPSVDTNGASSESFMQTLDNIAATAKTVASSTSVLSKSISSGILGISNAVNTAGANVGASSISLYLQRNGMTILIVILIAVVLIMIFARASKG